MIVSINQPAYLPWAGYFDRILRSDLHISLDHVQFEKNSLTNRNKIKTPQDWMWLTVPVKTKGKFKQCPLTELETNDAIKWPNKHLQSIISNYGKAPFFNQYEDYFRNLYAQKWPFLNDLLTETNNFLMQELQINTKVMLSSNLAPQHTKSELVLELCQKVKAKTYLSGPLGRDYLDVTSFHDAGIDILYHDYQYPNYTQRFGNFQPYLSVIDMLFNCGAGSHTILQNPPECLKQI